MQNEDRAETSPDCKPGESGSCTINESGDVELEPDESEETPDAENDLDTLPRKNKPAPGRIFLVPSKSAERGIVKQCTARKRESNRRNAQFSPGPTTERGKSNSRRNSLKHGLLARAIPLRNLPFYNPKDELEVKKLMRGLCMDWKPQGRTEEILVEEIAWNYVQLSRLCRFQTADAMIAMDKEFRASTVDKTDMFQGEAEVSREELHKIRSLVDQAFWTSGLLGCDLMERIYRCRFDPDKSYTLQKLFMEMNARAADFKFSPNKRDWEMRIEFLETLDDAISEAVEGIDANLRRPRQLAIARFEQHLLPDEGNFRKILPYHPMLSRELQRCIAQLEHLQARRRADEYRDSQPLDDSLPGDGKIAA